MTVETLLARLEHVRRTPRGWSARCPAHHDRSPSLSIAEGAGGRVLLHCFAGCDYAAVARALGVAQTPRSGSHAHSRSFREDARRAILATARRQLQRLSE